MTEFNRDTAPSSSQEPTLSARKAYHEPTLHCYGDVQQLTLSSPGPPFAGFDGGAFPSNYAS
jgi:hypothetical protein